MLKPRYVLGNHQACKFWGGVCTGELSTNSISRLIEGYGYSTAADLHDVVDKYRNAGIPLDGIHADVDFQVALP
jgi:alpha-glucosidase (family GH31 glycosyl hydrolase)